MIKKRQLCASFATAALVTLSGASHADVIASTNFDGRTATGAVASDLIWTTNGVEDPGDMTALVQSGPGEQTLFDISTLTQNNFAPALNTGNGNTFWRTNVALTVSAGSIVTLTDVSFTYVAVNGSAALNVPRESDFILTLLDPSDTEISSAIIFGTSGSGLSPETPTLTAVFNAPIALDQAGTYTLQINGGDLFLNGTTIPLGTKNETGNHTGIDNLSINGTVIPEPTSLARLGLGGLLVARRRRG